MRNLIQRICVAGDGWGARSALIGLAEEFHSVSLVSKDLDLVKLALSMGLEVATSLDEVKSDLIVCSGLKEILHPEYVNTNRVLNIHYSLLPKYRGLHSSVWAVLNNERNFGLTVHEMNERIDDGPIVYQYRFRNLGQNSREVIETCNSHIERYLARIVHNYFMSGFKSRPQKLSQATWVAKRNLEDCQIDFNSNSEALARLFLAQVDPYPLPRIRVNGLVLEIVKSSISPAKYQMTNGRVVNIDKDQAWIKISDGFLIVNGLRDAITKDFVEVSSVLRLGMRLS
jgi:methionyl-tRNA formyltransferase